MKFINACNRLIEYSFYALFLLTPLAFTDKTSELFEMNKMWLVWALTIIIAMSWSIKMVLQRKFFLQRTPLDIPIGLFLISQVISTIFSLDQHTSLWGYYSRFNGGLLSTISYILLYYAFLSNFGAGDATGRAPDSAHLSGNEGALAGGKVAAGPARMVKKLLFLSLISGTIVALWGLPSHFGYDPTCFIFRGHFDVSCWTADFMPKIRIFSTLGQPDWLAAYLAILIPISMAMALNELRQRNAPPEKLQNLNSKLQKYNSNFKFSRYIYYLLFTILFYVDLLYTNARSGFLGIWFALISFAILYYWMLGKPKISISWVKLKSPAAILLLGFIIITFIIGTPITQFRRVTLAGIADIFQKTQTPKTTEKQSSSEAGGLAPQSSALQNEGGTESGSIRLLVWSGAINAWKSNSLFGTGVETFAFAYYKYKPAAHNLTSEWNYLYNKAHNEYLNYLATTGIVGLGSYLLMIGTFLFLSIKNLKSQISNPKQIQNNNDQNKRNFENYNLFGAWNFEFGILSIALLASYFSILVTNFFGFSVVITNAYLFMIPAFVFILNDMLKNNSNDQRPKTNDQMPSASVWQWTPIFFILVTSCFLLITLFRFWLADIAFARGYNLDQAHEYQQAYPDLHKAVQLRGDEPVFKDELAVNDAIIAASLVSQKDQDSATKDEAIKVASSLVTEAINTSNEVISQNPNNVVFWKTRIRLFHALSQVDGRYLPRALDAIEKVSLLAPNDANIWYNLGVLYGQNNDLKKGISALEKTIELKPDYRDAHYALGLFYHTASLDKSGKVIADKNLNQKAVAQVQYILEHLNSKDIEARSSLENWSK